MASEASTLPTFARTSRASLTHRLASDQQDDGVNVARKVVVELGVEYELDLNDEDVYRRHHGKVPGGPLKRFGLARGVWRESCLWSRRRTGHLSLA